MYKEGVRRCPWNSITASLNQSFFLHFSSCLLIQIHSLIVLIIELVIHFTSTLFSNKFPKSFLPSLLPTAKMRTSTAAAFTAVLAGVSMTYAAPTTIPNLDINLPELPELPAIEISLPTVDDIRSLIQKRDADPQRRGRGRRIGEALSGLADGVGLITDGLLLNDAVNAPQKRAENAKRSPAQYTDAQRDLIDTLFRELAANHAPKDVQKRATEDAPRRALGDEPYVSTCPDYSCGDGPLATELGIERRWDECCS